jgi:hypothetical protein
VSNNDSFQQIIADLEALRNKFIEGATCSLEEFILSILDVAQFKVVQTFRCRLTEYWIRKLYPRLNNADSSKGEQWVPDAIEALQEDDVKFLLLQGVVNRSFIDSFKDLLRYSLRDWANRSRNNAVKNILHIPDEYEMPQTLKLFDSLVKEYDISGKRPPHDITYQNT